jgi:hypothetical protein
MGGIAKGLPLDDGDFVSRALAPSTRRGQDGRDTTIAYRPVSHDSVKRACLIVLRAP